MPHCYVDACDPPEGSCGCRRDLAHAQGTAATRDNISLSSVMKPFLRHGGPIWSIFSLASFVGVKVSNTLHMGERKVRERRHKSETRGALPETPGKRRGVTRSDSDGRHLFSSEGFEGIGALMGSKHEV